jgi:hypothetical protein
MRYKVLIAALAAPALMAADGSSGCGNQPVPTVRQIELNLPENIRRCSKAPKSPGYNATRRQTADYIVKLYAAWESCGGNLATVDRLYRNWQAEVRKAQGK